MCKVKGICKITFWAEIMDSFEDEVRIKLSLLNKFVGTYSQGANMSYRAKKWISIIWKDILGMVSNIENTSIGLHKNAWYLFNFSCLHMTKASWIHDVELHILEKNGVSYMNKNTLNGSHCVCHHIFTTATLTSMQTHIGITKTVKYYFFQIKLS